jgi:hypothetical protein
MVLAASFTGGNMSLTSSRMVRDFSHRAVNPPSKYKQVVIGGIPHGVNRRVLFMFCIDVIKYTAR